MTLKLNFDADRNFVKTDWIEYFNDFVKPNKQFRAPTEKERVALQDLSQALIPLEGSNDAEELQNLMAGGRELAELSSELGGTV